MEEFTKLEASTTRVSMHRLLAWATFGWHSLPLPSTNLWSIKWTYALLSQEWTWKKRSRCNHCRDTFICSKLAADIMIQDQTLHGRWYSAWASLFRPSHGLPTFGMALLWTSWSPLDLRHHMWMEDCLCSMIRIKALSLPQLFCTWMIT